MMKIAQGKHDTLGGLFSADTRDYFRRGISDRVNGDLSFQLVWDCRLFCLMASSRPGSGTAEKPGGRGNSWIRDRYPPLGYR
jgi:hypothetical protein